MGMPDKAALLIETELHSQSTGLAQISATSPALSLRISLQGQHPRYLRTQVQKAYRVIDSIHSQCDAGVSESDIQRVNQCGHIAPLRISPWVYDILKKSAQFAEETEGAVDITCALGRVTAGLEARHLPLHQMREAGMWQHIQFLPHSHIKLTKPFQLDLTSIANAFMVDKAVDFLSTLQLTAAQVQIGQEARVCQFPDRATSSELSAAGLPMLRAAVTSRPAQYFRTLSGHSRSTSLQHPLTGKRVRDALQLYLFASTAAVARTLSQAVLATSQSLWTPLLRKHDGVAVILTRRGEQIIYPA